jgi:hypothetical protein
MSGATRFSSGLSDKSLRNSGILSIPSAKNL